MEWVSSQPLSQLSTNKHNMYNRCFIYLGFDDDLFRDNQIFQKIYIFIKTVYLFQREIQVESPKLKLYIENQTPGSWKNKVLLVSDDEIKIGSTIENEIEHRRLVRDLQSTGGSLA